MFETGLVVGKFSPLHEGHRLLIDAAMSACRRVVVLSWSHPEFKGCEAPRRERWLRALYPAAEIHVLSRNLPRNDAPDSEHRLLVAKFCERALGGPPQAVFTSEAYGPGFAAELGKYFDAQVAHVGVDPARARVPISGTALRADPHGGRRYLPALVYADFVETVCLLGAESTGKSTLSVALARHFDSVFVEEYGRTLWEEKMGLLEFEDLLAIALKHIALEEEGRLRAHRFLFVDTSPLTTLFYSQATFGRADPALEELAGRAYDHVFLCMPDFPLVQDGTRAGEEFRTAQHEWYLAELSRRAIRYTPLAGSLSSRLAAVLAAIGGGRGACTPLGGES